jgi:hypothetical protein
MLLQRSQLDEEDILSQFRDGGKVADARPSNIERKDVCKACHGNLSDRRLHMNPLWLFGSAGVLQPFLKVATCAATAQCCDFRCTRFACLRAFDVAHDLRAALMNRSRGAQSVEMREVPYIYDHHSNGV